MNTNTLKGILALIPILGLLICLGILLFVAPPERELIHVLIGAFIAFTKDSYSYYFGSSDATNGKG